jgi:hypothetical protein
MTAYVVNLEREHVIVASDTAIASPHARLSLGSKIFPVVHLKALVFGRGVLRVAADAAVILALSPRFSTLDQAVEEMPNILGHVAERCCRDAGIGELQEHEGAEVVLAGWSPAADRMRLWLWTDRDGWSPHGDEALFGTAFTIPEMPIGTVPERCRLDDDRLLATMRAIREVFAAEGVAAGGEIHRWELRRGELHMRVLPEI